MFSERSLLQMANTFTPDDYLPPSWSAEPVFKFYFEVIKDGCVLGKLPIKQKPFNLVGRLEDLCDVPIDNQTVSRKHAILQAKQEEPSLYLYDLGSAHGTFVNKERLPTRTYKKLNPFDNVKFGVSSRIFVLRCPEHEAQLDGEQAERENKFAEAIQNQHRQLSKEELKERYLDLLENDPYFAANQAPRRLQGRQQQEEEEYEGIDWGISDEREVYAYKQDSELPIEPDLLRRLQLDQPQLNKLADYEDHLRKYQEVEAELNELTAREKREFGLEEKLQAKKEKLEKRFMEALETVEKTEDWLRTNIFGERNERDQKTVAKVRERENDTFGDDEYLDRTLENKENMKMEAEPQEISTEDYWKLEKELKESTKLLAELRERMADTAQPAGGRAEGEEGRAEGEEDELDAFMKDNDANLDHENIAILRREEELLLARIQHLRSRFKNIMGEEELERVALPTRQVHRTLKEDYKEKSLEESLLETKRKLEQSQNLENILNRLEAANEQEQELNELDPAIFSYYKNAQQDDEEEEEEEAPRKRQPQQPQFEKPISKHVSLETLDRRSVVEEEAVDLTRKFQ